MRLTGSPCTRPLVRGRSARRGSLLAGQGRMRRLAVKEPASIARTLDLSRLLSADQQLLNLPIRAAIHRSGRRNRPDLESKAHDFHSAALAVVHHLDIRDRPEPRE